MQRPERRISERRKHTRYTLTLEMAYSVLNGARRGETGSSQTIDLSSTAVRFIAAAPLAVGVQVEVAINWPVWLEGRVPLQLVTSGTVVRGSGNETVLTFQQYAFRTRRMGGKLVPIR